MPLSVRDGGDWKLATPFVRAAGVWKPVLAAYVRDGGDWKLAHGAVDWANIAGSFDAENADVVMPYSSTISGSLSGVSGSGQIYYVLNGGAPVVYSAPFAVSAGDTLHWGAQTKGTYSATVSVFRTGAVLIDTFTINLT